MASAVDQGVTGAKHHNEQAKPIGMSARAWRRKCARDNQKLSEQSKKTDAVTSSFKVHKETASASPKVKNQVVKLSSGTFTSGNGDSKIVVLNSANRKFVDNFIQQLTEKVYGLLQENLSHQNEQLRNYGCERILT